MQKKRTVFLSSVLLIGLGASIAGAFYLQQQYESREGLDKVWSSEEFRDAGGEAKTFIISSDSDEPRILFVVRNTGLGKPPTYLMVHSGSGSKNLPPPIPHGFSLLTVWPPDPHASGLWIDAVRQPLDPGLNVFYFRDDLIARRVPISQVDASAILQAAKSMSPFEFEKKSVIPRL